MTYLTLKEAITNTGKNESTIRRFAKKPESLPHVKEEGGKLFIEEKYLYKTYKPLRKIRLKPEIEPVETSTALIVAKNETIEILRQEVNQLHYTINQLSERNREQNIIIQSLQEKLKLLPPTPPTMAEEVNNVSKSVSSADLWIKILVGALLAFMAAMSWYIYR
jgi:hypothetical protein